MYCEFLRIDPHVVVIAVRRGRRAEALAAVAALVPAFVAHQDYVGVVGVHAERGVVERARDQVSGAVDQAPGGAGVFRTVEAGAGLGLDQRVDAVGRGGGDGHVAAPEEFIGQAAGQLGPVDAAIGALIDAALARAADDGPRLALAMPHAGEDHVRRARLEFDIGRAGAVGNVQHLLPVPAAVGGAVDAALRVIGERIAQRRHPHHVGVGGMHAHGGDLTHVAQAGEAPGLTGVGGFIDAAADGDIAADLGRPGARVDHVGMGERDFDGAHGRDRDLPVGDIHPGVAGVGGLPHAAAGGAHIEGVWLGRHAGDGGDAPAALRADHAILQAGP